MSEQLPTFHKLLIDLYELIFGITDINNNIIRKHKRNLEQLGDISFSLSAPKWKASNDPNLLINCPRDQLDRLIVSHTRYWQIAIEKSKLINNDLHLFLSRSSTFKCVIEKVLTERDKYGIGKLAFEQKINLTCDYNEEKLNEIDLTQLRSILLKNVTENLLTFLSPSNKNVGKEIDIKLSTSGKSTVDNLIVCGPILDGNTLKKSNILADEFYKKRIIDMRLMAEHKYGLRVTKEEGWEEIFKKLGEAAVIIELLQNNPTNSTTINFNHHTTSSSKGAPFILYNCARLAALFRDYEKKIASGYYSQLVTLEEVDFHLLREAEEWELLYVYILQFPLLLDNCIRDLIDRRINVHALCNHIAGMCATFSVYYRRVKILTEPREHVIPVLNARIALLRAVEQVLHTSLRLLNIEPVKQM